MHAVKKLVVDVAQDIDDGITDAEQLYGRTHEDSSRN
jgi:hypothetical protein